MDIGKIIKELKNHPKSSKMGMIATHLGLVRETSLSESDPVKSIRVVFDQDAIAAIVEDARKEPGIVEVVVETRGGELKVGDEIMAVAVGGDIRDNVFPVLINTVNRIKKEGSRKEELF